VGGFLRPAARRRVLRALVAATLIVGLADCRRASTPPPPSAGPALALRFEAPLAAGTEAALKRIYLQSEARGMVLALVDGDEVAVRGYGRMGPADPRRPDGATLVRLESLSKLFAADLLARFVADGRVRLGDPLQAHAPPGGRVPQTPNGPPITLLDLATHTAGLSRNLPTGEDELTATEADRWAWLSKQRRLPVPGRYAHYSNFGFDLLGDALGDAAGEPYGAALKSRITGPLGLTDTTARPTGAQCARMMTSDPRRRDWPCVDQSGEAASGGLYSTADDMALWLEHELAAGPPGARRRISQALYLRRGALASSEGLDNAGPADALGLAWVGHAATAARPAILEKTGGGDGFLSYVVIAPQSRVGVFVAFNNASGHRLRPVAEAADEVVAQLAAARRRPSDR